MPTRPSVLQGTLWRERAHPPSPGNNLPSPPTPLIGRDGERAQAANILGQPYTRLLTLYGPGGVGKTRLALAVATDLAETFPDGVYFVPLQDVADGGLILSAISQALELYTSLMRPSCLLSLTICGTWAHWLSWTTLSS